MYGLVSYSIGLGGFIWFVLFVGGWDFLPRHIESKNPESTSVAIGVNLSLILLFGLQHSLMARPSFKQQWLRFIHPAIERSTYVLVSGLIMGLICLFWQPIDGSIWQIHHPLGSAFLMAVYCFGWLIAATSTFLINHSELFGLQQVYLNITNKPKPLEHFTENYLYRVARHPLQLGILIGMWSTPLMSMTHFMLAVTMTTYIFIGLHYEEKDLVSSLGKDYKDYQKRVRMIIPFPK